MFKEATYQQCTASFEALCMARNQVTGHLIDNVSWPLKETIGEKKADTSCTLTNGRKCLLFIQLLCRRQHTLSTLLVIQFWLYNSLTDIVSLQPTVLSSLSRSAQGF